MGEAKRKVDHLLALHADGKVGGPVTDTAVAALSTALATQVDQISWDYQVKKDIVAQVMTAMAFDLLAEMMGKDTAAVLLKTLVEKRAGK